MITWDVKINVLSVADKAVSVNAIRIDSANPDNPVTYIVPRAIIETDEQKLAVMDEIWDNYQLDLTKQGQINNVIGTLETQAKNNLEGRE